MNSKSIRLENFRNWTEKNLISSKQPFVSYEVLCELAGKTFPCLLFEISTSSTIDSYIFNPRLIGNLHDGSEGVIYHYVGSSRLGDIISLKDDFRSIGRADVRYEK